jgi:hypothetical protein
MIRLWVLVGEKDRLLWQPFWESHETVLPIYWCRNRWSAEFDRRVPFSSSSHFSWLDTSDTCRYIPVARLPGHVPLRLAYFCLREAHQNDSGFRFVH